MSKTSQSEAETLDVAVIGAGFSGICAGIKLREAASLSFRIFEKSTGIGGTWWLNTYPGAACDVPSHFYCFSFAPNPAWSRVYSPQAEIQDYLERCVETYGLGSSIEFGTEVTGLTLDEETGLWVLSLGEGRSLKARHVISGVGALHRPSTPDFSGLALFRGHTMHTANWDHSISLAGKRVAVIGSAASAVQVVPEIAKVAAHVTIVQRTPNYIVPRNDRAYGDREKRRFARWPWFARLYRWLIVVRMEFVLFQIVRRDSWLGRVVARHVNRLMRKAVPDPELQRKLTPDYSIGCKRILVSDNYFAALNRDNVEVEIDAIRAFEENGIRLSNGILHAVDVVIFATGFDIDRHIRSMPVRGVGGLTLEQQWAEGAEAYNGACVAGFPNFFLATGPNTGVGTTSVVHMIEQSIGYILRLIDLAGSQGLISVRAEAQNAYNSRLAKALDKTVWRSGCSSWYIGEDGRIATLYPHNGRAFQKQLARICMDDFDRWQRPTAADTARQV